MLDVGSYLESQLTSGADDQALRLVLCCFRKLGVVIAGGRRDALDKWDTETKRFARTGFRLADDVAAFERQTQTHLLDRESGGDAVAGQGLGDWCADAEFGESLGFGWIRVGGYRVSSARIRSARRRGLVDESVVRGAQGNSWVREAP